MTAITKPSPGPALSDSREGSVVDIGLKAHDRQEVAEALASFLATTYTLYLEAQYFHWNVTGPHFHALHAMFEEQYVDLREAVDSIAERIRALGYTSPGTYSAFAERSAIAQEDQLPASGLAMAEVLLRHHEAASQAARAVAERADDADDDVTEDMMIARMAVHDKTAWMLRATLS